jgi:hypothetical protein
MKATHAVMKAGSAVGFVTVDQVARMKELGWTEVMRGSREECRGLVRDLDRAEGIVMHTEMLARQLRLATVTNLWRRGRLTDEEAWGVLAEPLSPEGDPMDDSALLGADDGLDRIAAEYEGAR